MEQMKIDSGQVKEQAAMEQKHSDDNKAAMEKQHSEYIIWHESEVKRIVNEHTAKCDEMTSKHSIEITMIENGYEDRLLRANKDIDLLKQQLAATIASHTEQVQTINAKYEADLAKLKQVSIDSETRLKREIERISDEAHRMENMRHEMLNQQAEEYERELSQQSLESYNRLMSTQHTIDSVNMQVQTLKSKREFQEKMVKDLRSKVLYHQNENGEVNNRCKSLEEEVKRMRQIILEKEDDLKKSAAALEEINFQQIVLEKELYMTKTMLDEVVRDKGPLEEALDAQKKEEARLRKQLLDVEFETQSLHRHSVLQEQNIKLRDKEIRALKNTVRESNRKLATLEGEIVHLSGITNDKLLQSQIKLTYQKYIKEKMATSTQHHSNSFKENEGSPLLRLSTLLTPMKEENRVQLADNKFKTELKTMRQSLSRRMSENAILIQDCDDLRRQNSELKSELARICMVRNVELS
jgi:hypothetical protein